MHGMQATPADTLRKVCLRRFFPQFVLMTSSNAQCYDLGRVLLGKHCWYVSHFFQIQDAVHRDKRRKGTETFQPKDAPGYLPGKTAILVLLSVQVFLCFLLRWINMRLNCKKLQTLEEHKSRHGWTDEDVERERQKHAFLDMTDKQ